MTTCRSLEEALGAYADGRATASERAAVDRHLPGCADCRRQLRWLQALTAATAGLPAEPMPADLKAELLGRARQASRRKTARKWRERLAALLRPAPMVGFAAGLAAVAVAFVLRGGPTETVPLDEMLAAHRAYAMTMPLTSQETMLSELTDALAGSRP